ncbi:DUF3298 and DUF4163 domain-containing protein [Spirosoma rhododendri]|uniref:DUF3298 and DUF4163 domain-containing protein n=1 Tax=Spirosoma rhododendri TaxID=2728024 RepID=A0A7L5DTS4_9BACT|nr:DUF3298 and DUF4163 domain-containing protein [Spirosoma rhododendri]QJD80861.1 DUF3298 and DUF4163 domain-containing protein [Spirosoma rhododendri]
MRTLFYLVPGCFLFLTACTTTPSGPPKLDRQQYTLDSPYHCDTITNKGIDVSVSYFQLADESDAGKRINDSLKLLSVGSVTSWLDSASLAGHPDARMDLAKAGNLFLADYQQVMADMNGMGGCWDLDTKLDTLYTSQKVLTVRMENYAYTGGAHPNTNVMFMNFDRQTGNVLALTDMVSDTTALLTIVERAFRKDQGLLPQYNLEERGYFLRDGQFFLPANIGIDRKGLTFYYNPYEIAAYALGPIEVTVPYEQLGGILKPGWH